MHLSFKSVCNKEHKVAICNTTPSSKLILPKAVVLQDECFGKNYSSFLDFTRNLRADKWNFCPLLTDKLLTSSLTTKSNIIIEFHDMTEKLLKAK